MLLGNSNRCLNFKKRTEKTVIEDLTLLVIMRVTLLVTKAIIPAVVRFETPEAASAGEEASPFCLLLSLRYLRVPGVRRGSMNFLGISVEEMNENSVLDSKSHSTINTVCPGDAGSGVLKQKDIACQK